MSDPSAEPWSIQRVLRWATEDFQRRDFDSPRLEAELLLSEVLDTTRIQLIVDAKRSLTSDELAAYRGLIQRRRRAEPIAYILGHREFYGLTFKVDRRVLVPRPDTETLVAVALTRSRSKNLFGTALDLCTGSGCVAAAFAKERPTWRVYASDISRDALAIAIENCQRLNVSHNVACVESNLFEGIRHNLRFDVITANPPYIPSTEIDTLQADVRKHEPRLALDGGAQGLDLVEAIVTQAPRHLTSGGVLALEVGAGQAPRVAEMLAASGFRNVDKQKDYGGWERVVSGAYFPGSSGSRPGAGPGASPRIVSDVEGRRSG